MPYDYTGLDGWYAVVEATLRRLAPKRVLMGGLAEARLPRAFPDTYWDVVELRPERCAKPPANVRLHAGDWCVPGAWPAGRWPVILADIDGEPFFDTWRRAGWKPIADRLTPNGAFVAGAQITGDRWAALVLRIEELRKN